MFIDRNISKGIAYLRLCDKVKEKDGSVKKRIIYNIGAESKVSDGKPDFVERLRESFKEGRPILPALEQYVRSDTDNSTVVLLPFPVKIVNGNSDGAFVSKLYADLILNAYMKELGLSQLFAAIKSRQKIEYDLLGFVKLLVYGRILNPGSKWYTVDRNNDYYRPILSPGFNACNIYDTLDVLHEHRADVFRAIDKALQSRSTGRDTSVLFYDVTNCYFEIEENAPDSDGVVIEEASRKNGDSKEKHSQPIMQTGLFMDRECVPLCVKSFNGNTVDKATLVQSISEIVNPVKPVRFVYWADRGLCTLSKLAFLAGDSQGYLLCKSIKNSRKEDRDWIIEPDGYTEKKDEKGQVIFKYKSKIEERAYTDPDNTLVKFNEKIVAFWSLDRYKREQNQTASLSDVLSKLEKETKNFTLNSREINLILRFLKDEVLKELEPQNDESPDAASAAASAETSGINTEPSEIRDEQPVTTEKPERRRLTPEEKADATPYKPTREVTQEELNEQLKNSNTTRTMIDWDKVHQWRDLAGYCQIVTTELEMDDLEIISAYRGLTQIANRFKTMKEMPETQPINVRKPEDIDRHPVGCAVALIIIALIQCRIKSHMDPGWQSDKTWRPGLSPDRIQKALNALQVETFPQNYLRFRSLTEDQAGKDLQTILDAHNITLEPRLYTPVELRNLRSSFSALDDAKDRPR